ncbi:MAG: hypothetical protein MJ224_01320 [archaeon]|nr:hypothetical protein [archaeon]
MTLKRRFDQAIEDIMDNFEFDRIEILMKALNWKWASVNPMYLSIPTKAEIKKVALRLLNDVVKKYLEDYSFSNHFFTYNYYVATGGFQAIIYPPGHDLSDDYPELSLEFIASTWSSTGEDYI